MLKKSMWYIILAIAFAGLITLSIGFSEALSVTVSHRPQSPTASTPQTLGNTPIPSSKNPNTYKLLIIGDSVAKGTGDEKNQGISGYLPEYFKANTPKEILIENAGTDGLESLGLLEQIQSNKLDKPILDSDMILISIGGNDIRGILTLSDLSKEEQFKVRQDSYLRNLQLVRDRLRTTNPNALIIFIGLYNPYAKESSVQDSRLLTTWNYNTQQLIEDDGNGIFIPTYDLMKFNLGRYIAQDGLHPNSAGYQAISKRINNSVEFLLSAASTH